VIAIATTKGLVLAFGSPASARQVGEQLVGMAEWAEKEGVPMPLLYSQRDDAISAEEHCRMLDALKKSLEPGVFCTSGRRVDGAEDPRA
jgi:hypothetical protein